MRPLLFLLLLAACDPVVVQRQVGPVRERTYKATEYKAGYCFTCMPGMGKGCSFKHSSFCPHTVIKTEQVAPFEQLHESGVVDTVWLRQ